MTTALKDFVLIPVEQIDEGKRYRKNPEKGIDKLAASIDTLGLLHPIVVLPPNGDGRYPLVVGQRRILAHRELGLTEIEARIARSLDEADRLLAEHDENMWRERMTPTEALACMKAREEILKPMAEERQQEGRQAGGRAKAAGQKHGENFSQSRTRETAAQGTGFSGVTLRKVEQMKDWASNSELPEEVRAFVQSKLDELEAAENPKVHPVFTAAQKEVKAAQREAAKQAKAAERQAVPAEPEPESEPAEPEYRGQAKAIASAINALAKVATTLEAAFGDVENFDHDITIEDVSDGFKSIRKSIAKINSVGKVVKDLGASGQAR